MGPVSFSEVDIWFQSYKTLFFIVADAAIHDKLECLSLNIFQDGLTFAMRPGANVIKLFRRNLSQKSYDVRRKSFITSTPVACTINILQ
jgi:hypothetical protein